METPPLLRFSPLRQITREPGPVPGIGTKIVACTDPDGYKYGAWAARGRRPLAGARAALACAGPGVLVPPASSPIAANPITPTPLHPPKVLVDEKDFLKELENK